jgi:hypothetical protein
MIRIMIDGSPLPAPDSYGVGRETVGEFARNAAGNMVGDLVAVKDVVTAGWRMMGGEDYSRLVRGAKPVFAEVEYFDPAAAPTSGAPTSGLPTSGGLKRTIMHVRPRGGRIALTVGGLWWKDVSCEFVER